MSDNIHIRISRSMDNTLIFVHERGGTRCYDLASWSEYSNMISDFNRTGVKSIQNYAELPTRTPIHANIPSPRAKASLDDLA